MTEPTENKLNALVERVRKVRRRLVLLALLKVMAMCLIFVSIYIGLYAWLDHKLHFAGFGRMTALIFLIAGITFLLFRLCKMLISHISLSQAANYIESKNNFEQQLVAAIEYHEDDADYPYSRELAGELIKRVGTAAENTDFDSTVSKRQMYVLLTIIVFGLITTCFYLFDNFSYFACYFTRLITPLAEIKPLPQTSLEPITEDITIEPNSVATLSAKIGGRLPESGKLVIADSNQNSDPNTYVQLRPVIGNDKKNRFETRVPFESAGNFLYRFESGEAISPWQKITVCTIPKIKSITANVLPEKNWHMKPYTEDVNDFVIKVIENSSVTLTIKTSENLSKAVITDMDGKKLTKELNNTDSFNFKFDAEQEGFIEFALPSTGDVANESIQRLQVKLKVDAPAKFKLISPASDYSATNVASVPISFEVTDDFGLKSVSLSWEIAGAKAETFDIPIEQGVRNKKFTRTLELENYDLEVGDSIVFYAKAMEINSVGILTKSTSNSDIYFIEIKPYRQRWHQLKPSLPGQPKQGLELGKEKLHDRLISVLEYTRAFVKKTWTIAGKRKLT